MNTDEIKEKMLHRIRATGRSELTFKTYWGWCEKYIDFLRQHAEEFRNPELTSRSKAERWLSSLANGKEWVSKNTQNLALQSICTTEIYVHANKDKATASKSPLESLLANPDLQQEIRKEHQVQVQKPTLRIFAG